MAYALRKGILVPVEKTQSRQRRALPIIRWPIRDPIVASVAFDAKGEITNSSTTTGSISSSAVITVGSSLSNGALIAGFGGIDNGGLISGVTMTWNSVNMPNITSLATSGVGFLYLFGMVAPASGAQVLKVSWTGTIFAGSSLSAISFSGANQSGGTSTFANPTTHAFSGSAETSESITINTAVGDATVALFGMGTTGTITSVNLTQWFIDNNNTGTGVSQAGNYNLTTSGTSTVHTANQSPSDFGGSIGCDVVAAATATDAEPRGSVITRPRWKPGWRWRKPKWQNSHLRSSILDRRSDGKPLLTLPMRQEIVLPEKVPLWIGDTSGRERLIQSTILQLRKAA